MYEDLERVLADKAMIRGGLKLYRYDDAVSLVTLCDIHNIQILGIDAFFVADGYTHPMMEHSIDLSNTETTQRNEVAYKFLESKRNLELVFEIVY